MVCFFKLEVKVIKKFHVLRKLRNLYSAAVSSEFKLDIYKTKQFLWVSLLNSKLSKSKILRYLKIEITLKFSFYKFGTQNCLFTFLERMHQLD